MRGALVVLVVLCGVARADDDDTRPTDLTIPVPAGDFTPATLPKDVPAVLPKDGWWKKKKPCSKGSKLRTGTTKIRGRTWRYYQCDGTGKQPRPYTAFRTDRKEHREEGWEDAADERHGMFLARGVYEQLGLWVHGKEEGRHEETPVGSGDVRFTTWKNGVRHGLERRGNSGKPLFGYNVDGKKVGVWLTTQGPLDDTVRARLQFKDGKRHGAQRWWTKDGNVLARGEFSDGVGAWTVLADDGSVHSTVDCAKTPDDLLCTYSDVPPRGQF